MKCFNSYIKRILLTIIGVTFSLGYSNSQNLKREKIQLLLDSLCISGNFPGINATIILKDNTTYSLSAGFNDTETGTKLKPTDKMPQGSVGKTYVAAICLQLIEKNKIHIDDKFSVYLGHLSWFNRIPNSSSVTIKMLLNHTSGIMRYEFKESFTEHLTYNPDKVWLPEELLEYVFDETPSFDAGMGWEYSDTNYILIGMVIEQVTGKKYYDILQSEIIEKYNLENTHPTISRKLVGISQGYAGNENAFGKKNKVIDSAGLFIINPQFEWTGGGIYSTTEELAKWGKMLYGGKVLSSESLTMMTSGVPAKLGKDSKYGIGTIIRSTEYGTTYGHSGFFPGYLTEMIYFPDYQITIAIQTNTSDVNKIKFGPHRCAIVLMKNVLINN